jgi:TorA maturation chaperone TorD
MQLRGSAGIQKCISRLQEDYNKLFTSTDLPCPAIKSNFITIIVRMEGTGKGKRVLQFYGWKNRSRYNIPDDLWIELLFLTLLNDKYISIDDDACRKEMGNEIRRFIEQHILSWLPEWNNLMQQNSNTKL